MAAHLRRVGRLPRPRGYKRTDWPQPAADKCSGLVGGELDREQHADHGGKRRSNETEGPAAPTALHAVAARRIAPPARIPSELVAFPAKHYREQPGEWADGESRWDKQQRQVDPIRHSPDWPQQKSPPVPPKPRSYLLRSR